MDLKGLGLSDDDLRQLGYVVRRGPGSPGPGDGSALEDPTSPRKRWAPATRTWVATLLTLTAAGWVSSAARGLPDPVPPAAADTVFSSGRAMAQLVDVVRGPRPTGSPENERVRGHLLGRLRSLGLEPEVQTSTSFARDSALVRAATVRNVVARIPGSASTGAIVLAAHYDAAPLSPGAGDDGMGVATVLEVVRALTAGAPLDNDVIVLFADGDELGQLGSRAFAEGDPAMSDVAVVLSADARGPSGPAVLFETGSHNGRLVETLAAVEPRPAAFSLARSVRAVAVESAEADPLLAGGAPGVSLTTLGDAAWHHQPGDTRARVSEAALQHGGRQLLALARALGHRDLRTELAGPDRVYLSVPRIGLVHYPRAWVLPTSLVLLAFWGFVGLVMRGRRATRLGVGVGTLFGAGVVVAVAGVAGAIRDFAADLHPEYGALSTAFYEDGAYALGVAALALVFSSVLYAVARRWARTDEILFGGLLVPMFVAVWLTLWEPMAAPALQLPLALALLGAALVITLGPKRARTVWAWAVLLTITAALLVLVVPGVELLSAAWTFRSATELGAVMGLGAVLLWPLMDRLLMPRWWWTPSAGLVTAGAVVLLPGLPVMRQADEHPIPTTLVYLADQPASATSIASGAGWTPDTSRVRTMAGRWLTVPGPGEEWARSWAGEPATGSTDAGVLLLGADALYEVVGTAPVSEIAPPRVTVTRTADEGAWKRVELALTPGLTGEMTGIHIPEGSAGALAGVGDARWDETGPPVRSLMHWGVPSTPELQVSVLVEVGATDVTLEILEHNLRPRGVLGSYFFQRPDSMVANESMGSDRAIQRTRLRLAWPADPSTP